MSSKETITSGEALLALYTFVAFNIPTVDIQTWNEYLGVIKKDLNRLNNLEEDFANLTKEVVKNRKILEIIKEKKVDINVVAYTNNANQYNTKERVQAGHKSLAEEEYNFLKEWAKNGS